MKYISLDLREPRPGTTDRRPERNNVWHEFRDTDRVLVFVHGFSDNSKECWFNKTSKSYWPDLVLSTMDFGAYSVFLGGYETSKLWAGDYGIPDCADALFQGLRLPRNEKRTVLDHSRIAFVCHSMGGIVTRYMLDFHQESFADRAIGLFMIASPSTGSKWADAVHHIAEAMENEQLKSLAPDSQLLIDLDRRFKALMQGKAGRSGARIFGREACETKGFHVFVPAIVTADSAGRYFGPVEKLPNTDHRTCVRPHSVDHPAHEFLRGCIRDFEQRFLEPPSRQSGRPVRTDVLQCRRLRRTVRIDTPDGDAQMETSFEGITAAPGGTHTLSPVQMWAGYRFRTELVFEGDATTSSITLETTPLEARMLRFGEPPQPQKPQHATWRYGVASVFSMNSRQLRLKNKGSLNEDFVGTKITAQFDELFVHVQLPDFVQIVDKPYANVVFIADKKKGSIVDELETARTAGLIDYSPLLRTISWHVVHPLIGHSYRVCWHLADVAEPPPRLTNEEELQHMAFRARLIWLRACVRKSARMPEEQAAVDAFETAVQEWRSLFTTKLGPLLQWGATDLTLMMLDDSKGDEAAQLYMVGGINAELRDEGLPVGDGNAGRAVKWEEPRIFDFQNASEVELYGYKPSPDKRDHRWLLSIPLIAGRAVYGVVNLGTFDETQVPVFRQLSANVTRLTPDVLLIGERLLQKLVSS